MTDYEEMRAKVHANKWRLPFIGENNDGETVFLTNGHNENGLFYCLRTAQSNGWERINVFYEDGASEEFYEK